jgi:phage repressor protein C with HTH and peptisase S24 domain
MADESQTEALARRIEERLRALRLTPRAASLRIRGNPDALRNILRAAKKGDTYNPRADTIAAVASALETTPEWLLTGREPESRQAEGLYRPPPAFFDAKDQMPVYASAEGGDGALIISTDPIEYVPRPYLLSGVKEAYAILITGESMVPAFKPGQKAWVDPRLPPMRGEECIFYSINHDKGEERALVKELVASNPQAWTVQQWNPPKAYDLAKTEWNKVHRIVGKFARA